MELDPKITGVQMQEVAHPTRTGGFEMKTSVRFFVGPHGPFIETFGAGEADAASINHRLNAKVLLLREAGILKD